MRRSLHTRPCQDESREMVPQAKLIAKLTSTLHGEFAIARHVFLAGCQNRRGLRLLGREAPRSYPGSFGHFLDR